MDTSEAPRPGGKVDDGLIVLGRRWLAARARLSRLRAPHRIGGLPVLGSLLEFRRRRLELAQRAAEMGDVVALELGVMPAVLVSSPELAHEVLVTRAAESVQAPTLRLVGEPLLGRGVLTAEGDDHRRQRRLLAPAFSSKRVAAYSREMVSGTEQTVAGWDDGAVIDVTAEMTKMTFAIAARVLFSAEIAGEARDFGRALTVAMETVLELGNAFVPLPSSWPTPGNRRLRRAVARLDRTVRRIIDERRMPGAGGDRGDVLSMLLTATDAEGRGMSDTLVRDEVMTLLLAGHETTANALSWTLYLLARNPDVRVALEEEVRSAVGRRSPHMDDLDRMPLVEHVVKESMRLYPPAYLVARYTTRDLTLGSADLPAGTLVFVNIYGMHRSAKYFADPGRFDPSRFAPPHDATIPKGVYLPFGAGPRTCIGSQFAMLEAKLALATLVRSVQLDLRRDGEVRAEALITLRPSGRLAMRVRRAAPAPVTSGSA